MEVWGGVGRWNVLQMQGKVIFKEGKRKHVLQQPSHLKNTNNGCKHVRFHVQIYVTSKWKVEGQNADLPI